MQKKKDEARRRRNVLSLYNLSWSRSSFIYRAIWKISFVSLSVGKEKKKEKYRSVVGTR